MRRFWIDRSCIQGEEIVLKGSLFHHICRVSQIQKAESFELFAEGLQKHTVVLTSIGHSRAYAKILKTYPVPKLPKPYIHLALSMPRFSKLDFIIEKSVELGVKDLHPFISAFSFINKASKFPAPKQKRLKKIVESSLALSGRTEKFEIHPICKFEDIKIPKNHRAFMAYEGGEFNSFKEKNPAEKSAPSGQSMKQVLSFVEKEKNPVEEIWLFIGSEGGFSLEEATYFSQSGGYVVSLGNQILRVETACLLGLSILKYQYHS